MARRINTLRRTLTAQIVFRFVCRNKRWRHKRHFRDSHLPAVPTVKGIQRFRFRRCYGAVKWDFGLLWCCESLHPACFQGIPRCCTGVAEIFYKKSQKFIAKMLDILSNLWYVVVAKNKNKGGKYGKQTQTAR